MNILVFGATGSVGHQVMTQALDKGHEVTAFVRDPRKLTLEHKSLKLAVGDVLDKQSVAQAIPGHEAVIIALGAGGKGQVRSSGTANIVQAMEKHGIARLICLSSLGVGESRGNLNFFWKYIMFGLLLRKAFADHVSQEQCITKSSLQWTIVRPGAFTDGHLTGKYKHGFPGTESGLQLKISRADVAHFMLGQLGDKTYLLRSPGLSYI